MKLYEILKESIRILSSQGIETFKTDSEIIISHTLGISRPDIYVLRDMEVPKTKEEEIFSIIEKRSKFIPLEYLLGYKYFWGMKFKVKEGVLIPRFDTESLIEIAKKICKSPKHILDIGTGTGILGITLKKIFPEAYVVMTDISEIALENCRENAYMLLNNSEGIEIVKSDVFDDIWNKIGWGKFDLIISNPPYIPEKEMDKLPEDVKKEPTKALYGGILGLDFYLKIADKVKDFIKNNGKIILEVGDEEQAKKVKKLFKLKGFKNFITFKDINNKTRGVVILNY
ncbi:MAG: peptide chain release factor N(5)-glutamine methyltransferase [Brevinematia bacterium]